jgi:hypothetical protein
VRDEVTVDWMRCGNEECQQLVVQVHEHTQHFVHNLPIQHTDAWIARPRFGNSQRPIDALVPEPDYAEASAILETSHRMSAVLARRILGDLLEKYAGKQSNSLARQIDDFTSEPGHPSGLTSNLHHFREVDDFAAHIQEDESGDEQREVIDVSREEAEWTLDLVDRCFDYFIVQPAKDEAIKASMDKKIARAGRKPLREGQDEDAT